MKQTFYNSDFYSRHQDQSLQSARIVAPLVMRFAEIRSAIDIGCGVGGWLKAFQENGVAKIRGVDGNYVDRSSLYIASDCFTAADLSRRLNIDDRFDLAICLEVAEHLHPHSASTLVDTLTAIAPLILLSAAVPGQGGIGHVNEQWPGYWRHKFEDNGFQMVDAIRPAIREDRRVEWWYRQNIVMFASKSLLWANPALRSAANSNIEIEWIHVNMLLPPHAGVRNLLTHLKPALNRAIANKLRGKLGRTPGKSAQR
jgi:SAM-dependent methyltransferase